MNTPISLGSRPNAAAIFGAKTAVQVLASEAKAWMASVTVSAMAAMAGNYNSLVGEIFRRTSAQANPNAQADVRT